MSLDPSLALQIQQPNQAAALSSFVDLGRKKLELDKASDTYGSDVAQSKAQSSSAQSKATVDKANVDPLIAQQAASTQQAQAAASSAQLATMRLHILNAKQETTGLLARPDSQLTPDVVRASVTKSLTNSGASPEAIQQAISQIPSDNDPSSLRQYIVRGLVQATDASEQLSRQYPNANAVNNGASTQFVAGGNPALTGIAPGSQQGVPIPNQVGPTGQEEMQADAQGNRYIVQRSPQGVIVGTRAVPGANTGAPVAAGQVPAGPVNLPPNETPETRNALQGERQTALQQVQNAGQLHQINREIYGLADSDVSTGKLGALRNKIGSALGYNVDSSEAADYNSLGKMLARSNQQLAQGMGPHTNAGLEQTNAANGTTEYDKNTIKKIANLNDALVTGTQMYQQGLERAIEKNGIFGKRQFDQAWGATMDPDALRLKNAVDNKDQGQIQMIIKQVGGKGSSGAKELLNKLTALDNLAKGQ